MTEPDYYKALLIEAMARLEALDALPGDFGGPFHVTDVQDLAMAMRWISAVHSDPPDWRDEHDPLAAVLEDGDDSLWPEVNDRAVVLLGRIRAELLAYHGRRGEPNWRGWWRRR